MCSKLWSETCSDTALDPSSGPDFGLFCIFITLSHNRNQFQTANDDPICVEVRMKLVRLKYDVISFAMPALLSSQQTRDDYRELLELTVFLLGGDRLLHHVGYKLWPLERYTEHGRWPNCVGGQLLRLPKLYCVKIWIMFKQQFRLTVLHMLRNL